MPHGIGTPTAYDLGFSSRPSRTSSTCAWRLTSSSVREGLPEVSLRASGPRNRMKALDPYQGFRPCGSRSYRFGLREQPLPPSRAVCQESLYWDEHEGGGCGHRTPKKNRRMAGSRSSFLGSGSAEPQGIAHGERFIPVTLGWGYAPPSSQIPVAIASNC